MQWFIKEQVEEVADDERPAHRRSRARSDDIEAIEEYVAPRAGRRRRRSRPRHPSPASTADLAGRRPELSPSGRHGWRSHGDRCGGPGPGSSEQPQAGIVEAAQGVVVDGHAGDAAVGGQHPGLRLDLLGGEDAADRGEQRVAVEQLEVPGQLLDAVDVAAALDLDRDGGAVGVAAEQVDRPDRGRVLAAYQREVRRRRSSACSASSSCRCASTPSLTSPGSAPRSCAGVVQDLVDADPERVLRLGGRDRPLQRAVVGPALLEPARRASSSSAACSRRRRSGSAPTPSDLTSTSRVAIGR